jgi:hypothetical protein
VASRCQGAHAPVAGAITLYGPLSSLGLRTESLPAVHETTVRFSVIVEFLAAPSQVDATPESTPEMDIVVPLKATGCEFPGLLHVLGVLHVRQCEQLDRSAHHELLFDAGYRHHQIPHHIGRPNALICRSVPRLKCACHAVNLSNATVRARPAKNRHSSGHIPRNSAASRKLIPCLPVHARRGREIPGGEGRK